MSYKIDLTDYSRLPNDLVSVFASFSLASPYKGYVPTFSVRICLLFSLNSMRSIELGLRNSFLDYRLRNYHDIRLYRGR